ncbi:MAG TPA: hypothetical protein VHR55_02400 [Candidatus Limnocylindria bacterium]|nr:hypothetical protein [Candidatus Limnocylindria bacterium]
MTALRDAAGGLAILVGTIAGVGVATIAIVALVTPAAVTTADSASPAPSFDVAVAPTAIGGRLDISGDRTGTMELDEAQGIGGGRYQVEGDSITIGPATDPILTGPNGRIVFDRDTGDITLIEFDDLALYLDPDECTITEGAINEGAGLMAALVECRDVADVRARGVIDVVGVVALPVQTLRGRAGLPRSGGTLELGSAHPEDGPETSVILDRVELFVGGEPREDGRVTSGAFTEHGGVAVEYDPVADQFWLTQLSAGDYYAITSEPCPIAARDLGRISSTTRVVELDIDCSEMTDAEGERLVVTGTIVADVIQLGTESEGH